MAEECHTKLALVPGTMVTMLFAEVMFPLFEALLLRTHRKQRRLQCP